MYDQLVDHCYDDGSGKKKEVKDLLKRYGPQPWSPYWNGLNDGRIDTESTRVDVLDVQIVRSPREKKIHFEPETLASLLSF